MQMPPEKRTPALMAFRAGSEIDSFGGQIDSQKYKTDSPSRQGNYSYELTAHPVALACPFGFCHGVGAQ